MSKYTCAKAKSQAEKRSQWIAKGLCSQCGNKPAVQSKKSCQECLDYHKRRSARLREEWFCHCGRAAPANGTAYCEQCLTKAREYRNQLRDEVYAAYGGYECACCGETEPMFLQLDHVNNDGAEHRRAIGRTNIYYWLKQNGFPPGFQVLCANCNYAKAHYGKCPHHPDTEVNHAPRRRKG